MRSPRLFNLLRICAAIFLALPALTACRSVHSIGYSNSRDLGIDSSLVRQDLAGKIVAVAIYTSAVNDRGEAKPHAELTGPKSSSLMYFSPRAFDRNLFSFWKTQSDWCLGLGAAPWHRLANGVGWNVAPPSGDGAPQIAPKQFNQAIFAGVQDALAKIGATAQRVDETRTEGLRMGEVARSIGDTSDYLLVFRHTYTLLRGDMGRVRCKSEVRASLFDTRSRRRIGWIFGDKPQPRRIKYRRVADGPNVINATVQGADYLNRQSDAPIRLEKESVDKTLLALAKRVRDDWIEWPHKSPAKRAAQKPPSAPR